MQRFGTFGEIHPHQFPALWAAAQQLAPHEPGAAVSDATAEPSPADHQAHWVQAQQRLAAAEQTLQSQSQVDFLALESAQDLRDDNSSLAPQLPSPD